jgi:prepilin-type N-terminal cleavage/methylation domain-containing protein
VSSCSPMTTRDQSGFTLLEVILALTICAIALVALFGVIAGSKQLTFRAQGALQESTELWDVVTSTMLVDADGELLVPVEDSDYRINLIADELEEPERKTETSTETLYQYEIENADGDVVSQGTYWVSLELAE